MSERTEPKITLPELDKMEEAIRGGNTLRSWECLALVGLIRECRLFLLEREKLTAEVRLLRRELRDRAEHALACRRRQLVCVPGGGVRSGGSCDCGLAELLERPEQADG